MTRKALAAQMAQLFKAQAKSDLSKKAFCVQHDIPFAKFYYWQRRLSQEEQESPVTLGSTPLSIRPAAELELPFPDQESIRSILGPVTPIESLGIIYHDHPVRGFSDRLAVFYELRGVTVLFVLEISKKQPNAYAFIYEGMPFIALGYYLYHDELERFGPMGVLGVLAHVYAHILQIKYGWRDYPGPRDQELEADLLAALFIARHYGHNSKQVDLFLESVYQSGDSLVHSCQHHGFGYMRQAAARLGIEWGLAATADSSERSLPFREIHDAFLKWVASTYEPPVCTWESH